MSDIELDMLISHIGEAKARELAQLARTRAEHGIAQQAFDEFAKAVRGFHGIYGAGPEARRALEAIVKRYPAET